MQPPPAPMTPMPMPSAPHRRDILDGASVMSGRQSSIGRIVAEIFESGFEDALSPDRVVPGSAGPLNVQLASRVVRNVDLSPDFMSIATVSSGHTIEPQVLLNSDVYVPQKSVVPTTSQSEGDHPSVVSGLACAVGQPPPGGHGDIKLKIVRNSQK